MMKNKKLWAVLSLVIAGLSIWAVSEQSNRFSVENFIDFVAEADPLWLTAALICMFGFIWFEGVAIRRIAKALGYPTARRRGTVYAAADVYFSAITPSASGGQPASAYFMIRDGIPGAMVTVILLTNLIMYSAALISLSLLFAIFRLDIVLRMSLLSRFLIFMGAVVMSVLGLLFFLLIRKEAFLHGICEKVIRLLEHIRVLRHPERVREKLAHTMAEYRECAGATQGKHRMLMEAFLWNVLQRMSQLCIPFCVFMARKNRASESLEVLITQCFVALGSNCIPVPGAMGVADYLMIDGYNNIVSMEMATYMELLCRSVSFYGCILVSILIVAAATVMGRKRE